MKDICLQEGGSGYDAGYSHQDGYGGGGGIQEGSYMIHTNGHSDGASPNSSSQA